MSDNGLITIPSAHDVEDTIDQAEMVVKSKGLTVFARVDHAAGAKEVSMTLAPTLLLFWQCQRRHATHAGEPTSRH